MAMSSDHLRRILERSPAPGAIYGPASVSYGVPIRRVSSWREPPPLPWLVRCGPLEKLAVAAAIVAPLIALAANL